MSILGTGLYPLPVAARLIGADARTVRRWLIGYSRKYKGELARTPALWRTQLSDLDLPGNAIGFRDLLELRLVHAFARHGVSLLVIKATADYARECFGTDYPLTSQQFLTDGKNIFLRAVAEAGESKLMDVRRRQFVFSDIVKQSLYAGIDFIGGEAQRWYPLDHHRRGIVLDPAVQFGTPILTEYGIPTDTLYSAFLAEEQDLHRVAREFDVPVRDVATAVRFEQRLAA